MMLSKNITMETGISENLIHFNIYSTSFLLAIILNYKNHLSPRESSECESCQSMLSFKTVTWLNIKHGISSFSNTKSIAKKQ